MKHRAEYALMGPYVTPDHHVFECRHFTEQANILERTGDTGLGHQMRRRRRIGLAGQLKNTGIRLIQAGNDVKERRFPGAVRADQTVDLPFHDFDINVRQRLQAAEPFAGAHDIENDLFAHEVSLGSHDAGCRCGFVDIGIRPVFMFGGRP